MTTSPHDLKTCPRCGHRRTVKHGRPTSKLCRDCRQVEPNWPNITPPDNGEDAAA